MTDPVVETCSGSIRGYIAESSEGFKYCAFKGVPYAEPPIGELRFKDPVPVKKWNGIKSTIKHSQMASQYDAITRMSCENEDCLYLNVYVKSPIKSVGRKPVMVWIHGGGFYFGSGDDALYGPDYLLRQDIVLVTVNYRLGVLGFLDLQDEIAPGNQGLKDQVLCLKWVQDNIEKFGGDPSNVTIFGESAGGACVNYLALSPLAKGLFHKAISQSGSIYCPWAKISTPKENAEKLCNYLGKSLEDPKDIVEFLRTVDAKRLLQAQLRVQKKLGNIAFGPGVDSKSPNPFMPLPSEELAKQGVHVPYLLGFTDREGIFMSTDEFCFPDNNKEELLEMMNNDFNLVVTFNCNKVADDYNLSLKQLRRLYYKSEAISSKNFDTFVDLKGDLFVVDGVHKLAKSQVERSSAPTYLYQFSYDPGYSLIKYGLKENISGASHFDEIGYLFKINLYEKVGLQSIQKGTKCHKIMQQITELWTNFAKHGRPTITTSELIPVHWQPVTDGTVLRYLNIDEDLTMQTMLNIEQKFLSALSIKT